MIGLVPRKAYGKAVRTILEEASIRGLTNRNIIINEFPRSGGTWLGLMISEIADISFPRNRAPSVTARCLLHCHYGRRMNRKKCVWLSRDGRDAMTSLYFYSFFKNWKNERLVDKMRNQLAFKDFMAVKDNMGQFIDFVESGKHPSTPSWSRMAELALEHKDKGGVCASYEDLKKETPKELGRICKSLGLGDVPIDELERVSDMYSFEKLAGKREKGEGERIGSFYRRGESGVWPEYFDEEATSFFISVNGEYLKRLGYHC